MQWFISSNCQFTWVPGVSRIHIPYLTLDHKTPIQKSNIEKITFEVVLLFTCEEEPGLFNALWRTDEPETCFS